MSEEKRSIENAGAAQFANVLNWLAQKEGLSSQDLSEKTGLSTRVVDYAKGGGKRIGVSRKSAEKLAAAFKLTYGQFLQLGDLLQKGHAPETVALIAGIYRDKKAYSECSPVERAAVEECLVPGMVEGFAALQTIKERQLADMAKGWNLPPKLEPQAAFDMMMDSFFETAKEWWRRERGGDADSAWAFSEAFREAFPEYGEWRKRREIMKNSEECQLETMKA